MGNTNKRSTTRSAPAGGQWDEANVLRLISEHKLAPKHGDSTSSRNSVECPICFLDFAVLNTVHCCKQMICTTCVVQLKTAEGKKECPFCGNAEMQVSLNPGTRSGGSGVSSATPSSISTPVKGKEERSNSNLSDYDQPSNRSSGSGSITLSYTTPEQEKKLRSHSIDATGCGGASGVATKVDREALERQIREQRLQFDERDLAEAAARDRGPHFSSASRRNFTSARSNNSSAIGNNSFMRFGARYRLATAVGAIGSGSGHSSPSETTASGSTEQDGSSGGARRFVGSFEDLLQGRAGIGGISSIQQLEDIMLMEAIRLSMQDATSSQQQQEENGIETEVGASTAATASVSMSQNTTLPNSSVDSRQTSPQRPASSVSESAAEAFRSAFVSTSGSGEDEEDEDQNLFSYHETDEHDEFRMSAGSSEAYPGQGSRESDVLSEEEEQIKLAMALSLATVQPSATSAAVPSVVMPPSPPSNLENHAERVPDMIVMDRCSSPGLPTSSHVHPTLSSEVSGLNITSCCSTPPEDNDGESVRKGSGDPSSHSAPVTLSTNSTEAEFLL